jgi:hypothetical protein
MKFRLLIRGNVHDKLPSATWVLNETRHTSRLLTMTNHSRNFLAAPGCDRCSSERTVRSSSRSFSFVDLLVDVRSYSRDWSVTDNSDRLTLTLSPRSGSRIVSHTPHFRSIARSLPCFDSSRANISFKGSGTEVSRYRSSTSLEEVDISVIDTKWIITKESKAGCKIMLTPARFLTLVLRYLWP